MRLYVYRRASGGSALVAGSPRPKILSYIDYTNSPSSPGGSYLPHRICTLSPAFRCCSIQHIVGTSQARHAGSHSTTICTLFHARALQLHSVCSSLAHKVVDRDTTGQGLNSNCSLGFSGTYAGSRFLIDVMRRGVPLGHIGVMVSSSTVRIPQPNDLGPPRLSDQPRMHPHTLLALGINPRARGLPNSHCCYIAGHSLVSCGQSSCYFRQSWCHINGTVAART